MLPISVIASVVIAVALAYAVGRLRKRGPSFKEPPLVPSKFPLIGHLVGLFWNQLYYYEVVRNRANGAPIFSLPILGARTYIISSPQLVSAVQKAKTIQFEPVVAGALKGVSGCSSEAEKLITADAKNQNGDEGFLRSFPRTMHAPLSPGANLNAMNKVALDNVQKSTDLLAAAPGAISLMEWLRSELTLATTNAVYGQANPFKDSSIQEAFWTFEENLMSLIINVFPSLTAKKGLQARSIITNAFEEYFTRGEHTRGSALIKARVEYIERYGLSFKDIAAFETGGCLALTANTYLVAFWLLKFIYTQPDILAECRNEIENAAKIATEEGTVSHTIDVATLKASCPLLASTFQETLRFVAVGSAVREVVEDTLLDGEWHLRKGMKVITPGNVLHSDKSIWGSNADEFDSRRFMKGRSAANPVAFRAFGGGATLCPGRHFATTEILAMAAMCVARFDMAPVGQWSEPNRQRTKLWAQIIEPANGFEVEVKERREVKGHRWRFEMPETASILPLVAEDGKDAQKA